MAADRFNTSVNASQEFFTKAGPPTLIPRVGFEDIPFDFWSNCQFSGHIDCELAVGFPPSLALSQDC
jgi:hypothetical protein